MKSEPSRIRRLDYWVVLFGVLIANVFMSEMRGIGPTAAFWVSCIVLVIFAWGRLVDAGVSGLFAPFLAIPFVGVLVLGICLFCPSKETRGLGVVEWIISRFQRSKGIETLEEYEELKRRISQHESEKR